METEQKTESKAVAGLTPADGSYASNQQGSGTVRNGQCGYKDIIAAIEKAGQLHERGLLTDIEFWKVKNRLLAKF